MKLHRRGFLLVSVLLITIILLTLGLAFLGKRAVQYRRAALTEQAAKAKAFAESGLEDALAKFRLDLEFPPLSQDQDAFAYTEDFDFKGRREGSYRVTIDGRYRFPPHSVWLITSTGEVGDDPLDPTASRVLRAEFDVAEHLREDKKSDNPYYFQVINFQDSGAL